MEMDGLQSWSLLREALGQRDHPHIMLGRHQTYLSLFFFLNHRSACSITVSIDKTVVITGGHSSGLGSIKQVSIFDSNEMIGRHPSLLYARESHGCTSYLAGGQTVAKNTSNKTLSICTDIHYIYIYNPFEYQLYGLFSH